MWKKIKYYLQATADTLMPRQCSVCGNVMGADERYLCRGCLTSLPRTRLEDIHFNPMEQLFAGKVPVERAAALFFYEKGSPYSSIVHDIKYHNMAKMGIWMGSLAVQQMGASGFFDGIDAIIPVPMHRDKEVQRGYNQAAMIAQGISQATGAPVGKWIEATKPHATQTRKGAYERWLNTRDTYVASPTAFTQLQGKHVLIVDDVITTGATIISCAEALINVPDIKISIFTLTSARLD